MDRKSTKTITTEAAKDYVTPVPGSKSLWKCTSVHMHTTFKKS